MSTFICTNSLTNKDLRSKPCWSETSTNECLKCVMWNIGCEIITNGIIKYIKPNSISLLMFIFFSGFTVAYLAIFTFLIKIGIFTILKKNCFCFDTCFKQKKSKFQSFKVWSSRGGLEVELWTDNSLPSTSVDQIPLGAMYLCNRR